MFDPESLPEIKEAIRSCTLDQERLLSDIRSQVRSLKGDVRAIKPRSTTSISLVASDGGKTTKLPSSRDKTKLVLYAVPLRSEAKNSNNLGNENTT